MRTVLLLALIPVAALSYACAHESSTAPGFPQTTGAQVPVAGWDAGPTEAPNQGWDNAKSNQQTQPPPSILDSPGSR